MDDDFKEWLDTRPEIIQKVGKQFPPGDYIIKEDAPYRITPPGTKVSLYSYLENGNVYVVLFAENKNDESVFNFINTSLHYNKKPSEIMNMISSDIKVEVDPIWLKPIKKM